MSNPRAADDDAAARWVYRKVRALRSTAETRGRANFIFEVQLGIAAILP